MQALNQVQLINPGAEFWVGETGTIHHLSPKKDRSPLGWPTAGGNFQAAVPGVANAHRFWFEGSCALLQWGVNVFIFEAFDETWKPPTSGEDVETHWGVWSDQKVPKFDLTC